MKKKSQKSMEEVSTYYETFIANKQINIHGQLLFEKAIKKSITTKPKPTWLKILSNISSWFSLFINPKAI